MGTLLNINCDDAESISFEINIPDIAEWEGSTDQRSWSLNGESECEPTFNPTTSLVTYSDINVATCDTDGPTATADGSKFEYEFIIDVSAEAGSTTDPVTFAYDHYYVVKCFYNREYENLMASFQPRHSLTDSGSGKSRAKSQSQCLIPSSQLWNANSGSLFTTFSAKISHKN